MKRMVPSLLALLIAALFSPRAEDRPTAPPDVDRLVAETHAASIRLRDEALRRTIAKDTAWPEGIWGDNLWCLSALFLNERVEEANARLLKQARAFLDSAPTPASRTAPEAPGNLPWNFFSVTDYVRTLCLFHSGSPRFPGRLKPDTEAAMKEALWRWVSGESRLADAGPEDILLLLGTENHDLNRRPAYYLVTALLRDDPAYRERKLADRHTTAEHAAAYTVYFQEWPRQRARSGLWVEVGSSTYQKYSWPALFNLHELAPDPVVRHRFGLLLDLACIEEAQISVQGRRGGGRSRAENGAGGFESMMNLLQGERGGSSHSRVLETSRYPVPPESVLLRKSALPPDQPVLIRNRVLGELEAPQPGDVDGQRLAVDSALVNCAWRTPHYLLGSTLQNPALAMKDPRTGELVLKIAGISRQKRACGMLFENPGRAPVSEIFPVVEHVGGGRPQHSYWTVQRENTLLIQRIPGLGRSTLGSYNTGRLGIRLEGGDLERIEEEGWIFVSNGRAHAAIRFLDGPYEWDPAGKQAFPAGAGGPGDATRILVQAGDMSAQGTFAQFRHLIRARPPEVTPERVDYRFGTPETRLEVTVYHPAVPERFSLPRIDGAPLDLRPVTVYQSPWLNGDFGSDRITVTVGPFIRVLDFAEEGD